MSKVLGAGAALCVMVQVASAEVRDSTPRVEGGAICAADDIASRSFARHAPDAAEGGEVQIHITAAPEKRWEAVVVSRAGKRRIDDETCRVVARAAGVIAALMAREAARQPRPGVEAIAAELPETQLPDADLAIETDAETTAREAAQWTGFRLGAGLGNRLAPTGEIALVWGHSSGLELELGAMHARTTVEGRSPEPAEARDGVALPPRLIGGETAASWTRGVTAVRAAACRRSGPLSACLGAESGWMTLASSTSEGGRWRGRGLWLAPTAGGALTVWEGRGMSAYARGALGYAVVRPEFFTVDDELVHRPGRLSARMSVGIAYRLR